MIVPSSPRPEPTPAERVEALRFVRSWWIANTAGPELTLRSMPAELRREFREANRETVERLKRDGLWRVGADPHQMFNPANGRWVWTDLNGLPPATRLVPGPFPRDTPDTVVVEMAFQGGTARFGDGPPTPVVSGSVRTPVVSWDDPGRPTPLADLLAFVGRSFALPEHLLGFHADVGDA